VNDEILYNIGLLMNHGVGYCEALIWAVNFYMTQSKQEVVHVYLH